MSPFNTSLALKFTAFEKMYYTIHNHSRQYRTRRSELIFGNLAVTDLYFSAQINLFTCIKVVQYN